MIPEPHKGLAQHEGLHDAKSFTQYEGAPSCPPPSQVFPTRAPAYQLGFNRAYTQKELRALVFKLTPGTIVAGFEIGTHLADGNVSRIFNASKDGERYVLKVLLPRVPPRLVYRALFQEGHGYRRTEGVMACYWRRRLVSRLAPLLDEKVEICDAVAVAPESHGFICPFVSEPPARTEAEKLQVTMAMRNLAASFIDLGLPTWAFDPDYPLWSNRIENVRLVGSKYVIIDYESGIPLPLPRGGFDLDGVDFNRVESFIKSNSHRLATDASASLWESFEECRRHTQAWHASEKRTLLKLRDTERLSRTVADMRSEGILDQSEAESVLAQFADGQTRYVLQNLLIHVAFGLSVGVFSGIIPLGMVPRGLWTIGNRIYYELMRNRERARVHTLAVLLWSSIPIPGLNYCGYLISLKKLNPLVGCAAYEHYLRTTQSTTLKQHLAGRSKPVAWLIQRLLVPATMRPRYVAKFDQEMS